MALFAQCESGGVLVGGRVPVAVNFVSEGVKARYNSIMGTLLAGSHYHLQIIGDAVRFVREPA
jgi:hypothetical protein